MKTTIVLCDRCACIIEEPHPDRISIYHHCAEDYTDYFGKPHTRNTYKADPPIHLCADCHKLLDDFLNAGKAPEMACDGRCFNCDNFDPIKGCPKEAETL